jgi:predicted permease
MRTLKSTRLRLRSLFRRSRVEQELDEELRHHLEREIERHIANGLPRADARAVALREFGNVGLIQERVRDTRRVRWIEDLWGDARHGVRTLARSSGFTATALLSLALGIGANAGVFALLDQVLIRPLAVREPERLVQLAWRGNAVGSNYGGGSLVSYPLCRELDEQTDVFDGVFCRHPLTVNFSTGREHESVRSEIVSGSYFSVLGVRPGLGRLIGASDDQQPGAHPVVVLSHDFWTTRFGGAVDIIGRRVLINSHSMTVIGVAPASFRGVDLAGMPALWIPAMMKRQATPDWDGLFSRRTFWMHAIGRLKPGMTVDQARARLQPWFTQMLEADLGSGEFPLVTPPQRRSFLASTIDVTIASGGVSGLRASFDRPLRILMGGAVLLLLLTSLNLAGLLLARGITRSRELATRMALGASRGRVARQLVVESILIGIGGGVLGVVAAPMVLRVLQSFLPAGSHVSAAIDARMLAFTVAITLVTSVASGIAAIFQLHGLHLGTAMTERSVATGRTRVHARKLLICGQIAFALILLVAAGLFVQTLVRLRAKGPGFTTANLMMFSLNPSAIGHGDAQAEQIMREVLQRLGERPEIGIAAVANSQILNGGRAGGNLTIAADERRVTDRIVYRMRVGPGFFETLGVKVMSGRDFDQRDGRPFGTPPRPYRTAIVNETFAKRYFGNRSPVGSRIGAGNRPDTLTDIEIIGIVPEVSRVNLRDQDVDQVFYNFWDNQSENGSFFVRAQDTPESAIRAIRAVVAEVDPRLPVGGLTSIDDQIEQSLSTERALATLSIGFGVVAAMISVVGLYGLMSYVATQRRQEIGLRMALGATRGRAVWLVVREALMMLGTGVGIALPAIWALRRIVEAQLFGIGAFHGPTIAAAALGLSFVGVVAAMLPAWRTSLADPSRILRAD